MNIQLTATMSARLAPQATTPRVGSAPVQQRRGGMAGAIRPRGGPLRRGAPGGGGRGGARGGARQPPKPAKSAAELDAELDSHNAKMQTD